MARTEAYGRVRESIDPDDFRGGFALWSGTSFSAPLDGRQAGRRAATDDLGPATTVGDAVDPGLGRGGRSCRGSRHDERVLDRRGAPPPRRRAVNHGRYPGRRGSSSARPSARGPRPRSPGSRSASRTSRPRLGDLDDGDGCAETSLARPGLARPRPRRGSRAARAAAHAAPGRRPRRSRRSPRPSRCSRRARRPGRRPGQPRRRLPPPAPRLGRRRRLPRGRPPGSPARAWTVEQAKAEHNLGYALMVRRRPGRGARGDERAVPVLAPVSPVRRAVCDQDRAEVLMATGLVRRGRRAAAAGGARLRPAGAAPAPGRGRARAGPRPGRQRPGFRAPAGRVRAEPVRTTGPRRLAGSGRGPGGGRGRRPGRARAGPRRPGRRAGGAAAWPGAGLPRRPRPGSTARAC